LAIIWRSKATSLDKSTRLTLNIRKHIFSAHRSSRKSDTESIFQCG